MNWSEMNWSEYVVAAKRFRRVLGMARRGILLKGFEVHRYCGLPIQVRGKSSTIRLRAKGQIAETLYCSRFEETERRLIGRFLKPGMRVLDVGANVGLYSLLAAEIVGPSGTAWAFEPSRETYEILKQNLSLNHVRCVHAVCCALSDVEEQNVPLLVDDGDGDAERFITPGRMCSGMVEQVAVTTLDAFSRIAGIDEVDFIKIDVEGSEYRVLGGARQFLAQQSKVVMMLECSDRLCRRFGHGASDLIERLNEYGFTPWAWDLAQRQWTSGLPYLLTAGNVWATRDRELLPTGIE